MYRQSLSNVFDPDEEDYLACDMCTVNIDTEITKHPECKTHQHLVTAEEFLGQETRKRCHCSAGPGWCRCED